MKTVIIWDQRKGPVGKIFGEDIILIDAGDPLSITEGITQLETTRQDRTYCDLRLLREMEQIIVGHPDQLRLAWQLKQLRQPSPNPRNLTGTDLLHYLENRTDTKGLFTGQVEMELEDLLEYNFDQFYSEVVERVAGAAWLENICTSIVGHSYGTLTIQVQGNPQEAIRILQKELDIETETALKLGQLATRDR